MILEHEKNVGIVLVDGYGHMDIFGKRNYVKIICRIKTYDENTQIDRFSNSLIVKFYYSNTLFIFL